MKKALILLAPGFETIEATTPMDVLRRCQIPVVVISVNGEDKHGVMHTDEITVISSHSVSVKADYTLSSAEGRAVVSEAEMVILPGGFPGYLNLAKNKEVGEILKKYEREGKLIGAICGAPTALKANNIAPGSRITCHTSVKDEMTAGGYVYTGNNVEKCGNLITGKGAGLSLEFALECALALTDAERVAEVKKKMEL